MYYRNANAAILVFDLTQYKTFTEIKSWIQELHRNVQDPMILTLVGNKMDMQAQRTRRIKTKRAKKSQHRALRKLFAITYTHVCVRVCVSVCVVYKSEIEIAPEKIYGQPLLKGWQP